MIQVFNTGSGTKVDISELEKSKVVAKHSETTKISHIFGNLIASEVCPPGYGPREQGCVKLDSTFHCVSNTSVHPCFYGSSPNVFLRQQENSTNLSLIHTTLQNVLINSSTLLFNDSESESLELTSAPSKIILEMLYLYFSRLQPLLELIDQIVLTRNSEITSTKMHSRNWYNETYFTDENLCAETFPIDIDHIKVTNSCTAVFGHMYTAIPFSDIPYLISVDKITTSIHIKGCKRFYEKTSCIAEEDGLPESLRKRALDLGYIFCTSPYGNLNKLLDKLGGYISFGGSAVSILCSIISLVTFHLFPQTLPFGLICLCVCFLMSDTLHVVASSLIATDSLKACKGLAVALHLCAIELQCCSVVSAVDIAMKFGVFFRIKRQSFGKYLLNRFPFLVLIPTSVVGVALLFDYLDIVEMSYGTKGMCLVNGYYGRLLFYVAPNGLSVICTSVLVIFTLRVIGKQNRQGMRSLGRSSSTRPNLSVARISLKVVLAYGMNELVGFVQFPGSGDVVGLINNTFGLFYDVVRSFRGATIFFMYICKPLVLRLYLDWFRKRINGRKKQLKRGNLKKTPGDGRRRMKNSPTQREDVKPKTSNAEKVESKNAAPIDGIGVQNQAYIIFGVPNHAMAAGQTSAFSSSTHHQRALSIARAIGAELIQSTGDQNLPEMKDERNIVMKSHLKQEGKDEVIEARDGLCVDSGSGFQSKEKIFAEDNV